MTHIEETLLENLEEKAFETLLGLLHSEKLEKIEFNDGSDSIIEVFLGEPAESDGHVVVSTFGAGGSPTKGFVNFDGKKKPYRSEFFGVAKDMVEAKSLAETLAKLAFIVDKHAEIFTPGVMIGNMGQSPLSGVLISEAPKGTHSGHGAAPILTEDFALFWVAVTPISSDEASLLEDKSLKAEFDKFAQDQGLSFYGVNRERFSNK